MSAESLHRTCRSSRNPFSMSSWYEAAMKGVERQQNSLPEIPTKAGIIWLNVAGAAAEPAERNRRFQFLDTAEEKCLCETCQIANTAVSKVFLRYQNFVNVAVEGRVNLILPGLDGAFAIKHNTQSLPAWTLCSRSYCCFIVVVHIVSACSKLRKPALNAHNPNSNSLSKQSSSPTATARRLG